jgi:hypothetical protein
VRRERAQHPVESRWEIDRFLVRFSRDILSCHVDIYGHSEVFGRGQIGEMGVEEWGYPFNMRGVSDIPYEMQVAQRRLVGSGKVQ